MWLRDVEPGDVGAYIRMRCDPVMMADLGGPRPPEDMAEKVRRDVQDAVSDNAWIKMIIPDEAVPDVVAGTVTLWSHDGDAGPVSEIGWMVLPEFQGRGLGRRAVRTLLTMARDADRWGLVHAFTTPANMPSNGICRSLGFRFVEEADVPFAGHLLRANHWVIDVRTDLTA